ncbi:MAG: hypothetical protein JST40_05290 [Armatimonadetes bacterium]|nr:hypothetical protein [Armatimonadota bacterium]
MYFRKIPYAANFEFATRYDGKTGKATIGSQELSVRLDEFANGVFHLELANPELWGPNLSLVELNKPCGEKSGAQVNLTSSGEIQVINPAGKVILESVPNMGFGLMGKSCLFTFLYDKSLRFLGLGEKTFPELERSRKSTRFWNTDALGDYSVGEWMSGDVDPYYASIPYVAIQNGSDWVGLLYHNPGATFMDTGTDPSFFKTLDENRKIVIGSDDGTPSLWILVAGSLAELTRKLQMLVGAHPIPPLWALGYHQCRWGYGGEKDLLYLDAQMEKHQIPNDGLWLDIDYMDEYRVFAYAKSQWPHGVSKALEKIRAKGRKVVPIIDPGVKLDPQFEVYKSGKKANIYCKNPQHLDFVGFVWPGETVFPDFARAEARSWWSGFAKQFIETGFSGAWVDMNDPATGAVDPHAMLFNEGKVDHHLWRNEYALGMQMATFDGFQKAQPGKRVFMISRSASTGTSRYSAVWTGDNVSNREYLQNSIPCSISLGLSGIPFNGPDVGGFVGDTNEALISDWHKAGFLFPFFRNHSNASTKKQEPWVFSKKCFEVLRHYIQLRYKLLPYLYNVFIQHYRQGDPILRPLAYHFSDKQFISDQFLVGSSVLQAPHLKDRDIRVVVLPGRERWFDAGSGNWLAPGKYEVERTQLGTPLYFRNGAIIPCLPGIRTDNSKDLREVEIHVFLDRGSATYEYVFDDGETLDYLDGKQSVAKIDAIRKGDRLELKSVLTSKGFGSLKARFFLYENFASITLNGTKVKATKSKQQWTDKSLPVWVVEA